MDTHTSIDRVTITVFSVLQVALICLEKTVIKLTEIDTKKKSKLSKNKII